MIRTPLLLWFLMTYLPTKINALYLFKGAISQGLGNILLRILSALCCMNHGLEFGTVFEIINKCKSKGYSFILLYPQCHKGDKRVLMSEYCKSVWQNIIEPCVICKNIYILSESDGGYCINRMIQKHWKSFSQKVRKIALVNSSIFYNFKIKQWKYVKRVSL